MTIPWHPMHCLKETTASDDEMNGLSLSSLDPPLSPPPFPPFYSLRDGSSVDHRWNQWWELLLALPSFITKILFSPFKTSCCCAQKLPGPFL